MDNNSNGAKSSSHENGRNSILEPLLSEKLNSVSQTSGKHSRSRIISSRHSSSSSAQRKARAEAAAAKQEAEFNRLLAEKEREKMEMEAGEGRKCQPHLAKFLHKKAVLTANKKAAIAEAKTKGHRTSHRETIQGKDDNSLHHNTP